MYYSTPSAAFDTVDHNILLHRLGLSEIVLKWLRSYLGGRGYYVSIGKHKSEWTSMTWGVFWAKYWEPNRLPQLCRWHTALLSPIAKRLQPHWLPVPMHWSQQLDVPKLSLVKQRQNLSHCIPKQRWISQGERQTLGSVVMSKQ